MVAQRGALPDGLHVRPRRRRGARRGSVVRRGSRERTLLKFGYYGHYEVNLGVVVPDDRLPSPAKPPTWSRRRSLGGRDPARGRSAVAARQAVLEMTLPTRRGFVVGCAATLAGCGVLPEEREPIEASAAAPAVLPESSGYSLVAEDNRTIETTVTVDALGTWNYVAARRSRRCSSARPVRRRGQFGLPTAPAVRVVDQPAVVRTRDGGGQHPMFLVLPADVDTDSVGRAPQFRGSKRRGRQRRQRSTGPSESSREFASVPARIQ